MISRQLLRSLENQALIDRGRGELFAHSPDGLRRIGIETNEVYPAASSIEPYILYRLPATTAAGNIAQTVLFVLSMAQTARSTNITILLQRSSDA